MINILLIDDDDSFAQIIFSLFDKNEYKIQHIATAREGLDKAKVEKPDVILLDEVLPDLSGIEVLRSLKSEVETKEIPVIMLTAFPARAEMRQSAINFGATDFILKFELEPQHLQEKINTIVKSGKT